MVKFISSLLFLCVLGGLNAQSLYYGTHTKQDQIIERSHLLSDNDIFFFPNIRPYDAQNIIETSKRIENSSNREQLQYIYNEYNEFLIPYESDADTLNTDEGFREVGSHINHRDENRYLRRSPILKYFYSTPGHFLQYDHPHFTLRLNPIIHFGYGREEDNSLYINQRGISLRASIDQRFYIMTSIIESQSFLPLQYRLYENNYKAIPQNGFYKNFNSSIIDDLNGYDYLNGQAVLGFKISQHISGQFGYSRHFIGNGMRSLFLSDFSDNYLNLSIRTRFKRFFYQNIYGETFAANTKLIRGDNLLPKKYFAAHYLGVNVTPDFQLGLFESVTFSRNNQLEFHYLLPVILYRTVEGAIGSPDNVLIGLDARWDLWNQLRLYGQLAFDELKVKELIIDNKNWWGNKYAFQLGAMWANSFNLKGLDLQAEYNYVRPWMYSHTDSSSNYIHGNTPLAHPMGSNLKEFVGKISYQPNPKWNINLRFLYNKQGMSSDSLFVGENPRVSNTLRKGEYDHKMLQGDIHTTNILDANIEYMLFHNFNIYLNAQHRRVESDHTNLKNNYLMAGIRWNIGRHSYLF